MVKGAKKGGRVRDKWRDKQWIIVNAPAAFGGIPLNHIPITDAVQATGRVIENTMYDIMKQDPSQHQIKVFVQIDKINDGIASTVFKGHEYAKEFLRSLIRRGSSMITFTHDYTTMDGHTFRVATVVFSQRRVNTSRKHEIRLIAHRMLSEKIPKITVDQFAQEVTMGKMASEVMAEAKKVTAIRHLGIRKTKLISTAESRAVEEAKPVEAVSPAA
ncbi:MAG: 30S ribosomal protein S3ae [Nitrososphaera sp.]|nr:30S ribosomal protein S3ae [Nitrososphaera sp.]